MKKERNYSIDLMKTILVLGMILSHTLDSLIIEQNTITIILRNYFNLVSFSGFMFIFGYNAYNSYIINENNKIKNLLKNILKILIIFWISGFLFDYFALKNHDINNYVKILLLLRLPGYSEFLVTFILVNLSLILFKKIYYKISKKNKYIIIAIIVSLLFTIVPPIELKIPWINLFLRTNESTFPLLPYINLFFFGIYFAKNKPKYNFITLVILTMFYFIYYIGMDKTTRFPISLYYMIGSYVFIYGYYYISKLCNYIKNKNILSYTTLIGKNSLLSLLISNIFVLILPYYNIRGNGTLAIIIYLIIIFTCYLIIYIINKKNYEK